MKAKDYQKLYQKTKPESAIQRDVSTALIKLGWLVVRINSGAYNQEDKRYIRFYTIMNTGKSSGLPDLMAMKNGRTLLLEVKTPKGRLRASQIEFAGVSKAHGNEVHIVRSAQEAISLAGAV